MTQAHCEWGLAGLQALRERCAVVVVVDVLSFCTAVDVAVTRGARIWPFAHGDEAAAAAEAARVGAVLAARRRSGLQLSLSPASLARVEPGASVLLPSPNGSRLSLEGEGRPVLAGCLRNAGAVARAALRLAGGGDIAVIPAGERWPDGSLRPAVEDLIGAGAVIDRLGVAASAEAKVAREAFAAAQGSGLAERLRDCLSGRELIGRGFAQDVEIAAELDVSRTAPLLQGGAYAQA
ncbi:MAG: 2-phosphosulfolactate phosphatase [Phenylobacterium sp.]|uniref:2-phosphosulfolactate phosphatase n=1 Tax=Phenylobacterium sp. TaxID=1871053 RepID=UPI00391C9D59